MPPLTSMPFADTRRISPTALDAKWLLSSCEGSCVRCLLSGNSKHTSPPLRILTCKNTENRVRMCVVCVHGVLCVCRVWCVVCVKSKLTTALRDPGCRIAFNRHAFSGGVISFRDIAPLSCPCLDFVSLLFSPSSFLPKPSLVSGTDECLFKLGAEKDLSGQISPPLLM